MTSKRTHMRAKHGSNRYIRAAAGMHNTFCAGRLPDRSSRAVPALRCARRPSLEREVVRVSYTRAGETRRRPATLQRVDG